MSGMEDIRLERATEADIGPYLSVVGKVESRTYVGASDAAMVRAEMEKGIVYMIRAGDDVAGIVSYEKHPDGSAYISELAVDPRYQGKGIARQAMTQVLAETRSTPRVWLMTHPDNAGAIRLYESLGFRITGEPKENYFGDGQPRVELVLDAPR